MKQIIAILFASLVMASSINATPPVDEGKSIFTTRCAGCHNVNKILTGPALAGVDQRHSIDWIVNFVHSSQTMVKSGDKDAVALFTKFNKIPMPDHPDLSAVQIKNVVEFIKSEAKAAGEKKPDATAPVDKKSNPSWNLSPGFIFVYAALAALLFGVIVFAVQVKKYEKKALRKPKPGTTVL